MAVAAGAELEVEGVLSAEARAAVKAAMEMLFWACVIGASKPGEWHAMRRGEGAGGGE